MTDRRAVAAILCAGLVVGWPLWTGGWATFLDNPSHVAELLALARGERWHPQAFLGFPVHLLHSPLAYGAAAALVAAGLPVGLVYGGALLAGLCAPALAVYRVARTRWEPTPAAALGLLVLVHPNALVGYGATTGGMWTFHLACAALILLLERVARPDRGPRDVVPLAAGLGLVAALHPMVTVCAVGLAVVSVVLRLGRPRELLRALPFELAAAGLGALLSSGYWAPSLWSGQGLPHSQQSLSPAAVLLRLTLPTDLDVLWRHGPAIDTTYGLLDAVPMVLLSALGAAGAVRGRHHPVVRLASAFTAALLGLLLLVTPNVELLVLGPLTWRLITVVQLGAAVAATGLTPRSWPRPRAAWALGLGVAALSSIPLARAVPTGAEVAEVEALWGWLREHRGELDGRVYLQSTLGTPPLDGGLSRSQLLARTAGETGVDQVGAWYGISPYPTGRWTPGEFGRLFRQPLTPKGLQRIEAGLTRVAASHVVVSDPAAAEALVGAGLHRVHEQGRFTVLRRDGPHDRVLERGDRRSASVTERRPGELRVTVGEGRDPVVLSFAWHPFWQVEGLGALTSTSDGLMSLALPPGSGAVTLRYRAPLELGWLGLFGGVLLGAAAFRTYRSKSPTGGSGS